MNNLICICSHPKNKHRILRFNKNTMILNDGKKACMFMGSDTTVDDCSCYDFKLDNLKYLESLNA